MEDKMKEKNQHIDLALMARYLSLEAGREEISAFEKWLDERSENRNIFNEYSKLWKQVGKVGDVAGLDLDAEWKRLEEGMEESLQTPVVRMNPMSRRRVMISRYAVAAIVVFALTLGSVYISRNYGYQTWITEDTTRELVLPDGSEVSLNAHSGIQYKKRFNRDLRRVNLEGEAFFQVERDVNRPFIITADGIEVKVLGTSFNVRAYEDNDEIEVVVSTGQVALTKPGKVPESVILKPGNKGVFNRTDHTLAISRDIDRNYLAWKTRSFVFKDQTLVEVVEILNRVYNSSIDVTSDSLKEARITTSFNDQTLDAILNVLSATLDFDMEQNNGKIILKEGI